MSTIITKRQFPGYHKYEMELAGRPLTMEVGKMAELANAAVMVGYGDTRVLVCATAAPRPRDGIDFFPLSVDFEEKLYSVGRIPGSFNRREGRPGEKGILTSRVIDRPIRPLFPSDFRNDVSVMCTVMSMDHDCSAEIAALIGTSAALAISDIPWNGPVGALKVGLVDGELVLNPNSEQRKVSDLDVTVVSTGKKVVMIEAGANQVDNDTMYRAIELAHQENQKQVALINQMVSEIGKPKFDYPHADFNQELFDKIVADFMDEAKAAMDTDDKNVREARWNEMIQHWHEKYLEEYPDMDQYLEEFTYKFQKKIVKAWLLEGHRVDGRQKNEIRPLSAEVGVLPRVHGSGLFTRGQTQVLSVATLDTLSACQKLDTIWEDTEKRYMHHYNFPGYSVGEAKPARSPGRREIGHGALAERALLPVLPGQTTEQGSVMAWGCDPDALSADPYTGAHSAVYTSVAKIVAAGADYHKAYLTLQEFFEKLRNEPVRWGKPFAALLGALDAQLELGAAAIGGKDSMSGTFLDHDVPPTLISFAIAPVCAGELVTTDFKSAGHGVYLFYGGTAEQKTAAWERFTALARAGKVASAWAVENGLAEAVMKMSLGNEVGFAAASTALDWYRPMPGAIVAELTEEIPDAVCIGITTAEKTITIGSDEASISELLALNDSVLESVYPTKTQDAGTVVRFTYETEKRAAPAVKVARPKALIPVFPGTNCEYDTQRALLEAGADAEQFIIRNLTSADVADSVERFAAAVKDSQIIVIPGGFSGGDEPDGSAKLITAFFRNAAVKEQVTDLLEKRDGLMLGVCNGFQALIKLGLVPYGKIMDTDADFPTLTYNVIGRHQSRLVRTRVCSNKSPWLAGTKVGDIYTVPISHGEGRFLASEELVKKLAENGQIATQYVDLDGYATMDAAFNPNGSICAIEGITSPDGRVFGKMGHTERIGKELYRNVPGQYEMELFTSAVRYFK